MFLIQFSCLFIILISCSHSFIILHSPKIGAHAKIDYLRTLADETISLVFSNIYTEQLTFIILTIENTHIFKSDMSDVLFDPTFFNLKNDGSHRNESIPYIKGNFVSNSTETFPSSGFDQIDTKGLQLQNSSILSIDQYFKSFKPNDEDKCISDLLDCCDYNLKSLKSKRMKNGMILVTWLKEYDFLKEKEVYFTILDGSCTKSIVETIIGNTVGEPRIECLENGKCVVIYLKMTDIFQGVSEIVVKILDSTTNAFGEEINVATAWALDYTITSYSNSNFMIAWTDIPNTQIVGRVYSLDCLEYIGEICKSCANSKVLSEGGKACVTPIEGCKEYSANGKCTVCAFPTVLNVRGILCKLPIANCSFYEDDGRCSTCDTTLIKNVDGSLCFSPINDCLSYSDDGFCEICQGQKTLTIGKIACVTKIISCLEYENNGKCKTSDSPKVFPVSSKFYVASIKNCLTHSNNGLCQSCKSPKQLTVGRRACVNEIKGCLIYSDNGLCATCLAPRQLTVGKKNCVPDIEFCLIYANNEKCLACAESHRLILSNSACGPIIEDCLLYSADGQLCLNCEPSKKPIEGGMACQNAIIEGCTSYSIDNKCLMCNSSKVLINEKTACVDPIQDCLEYTSNGKCLACDKKVLSSNKKKCFDAIAGCMHYSDSKCKACHTGTKLSEDKHSCIAIHQNNNKIIKKISVNISDNLTSDCSSNSQKAFSLKDELQTMEINSTNDFGYEINLKDLRFLLVSSYSSQIIQANSSYKNANSLVLTFNLSDVPTGTYILKLDLSFTKKNQTIIQEETNETLPEFFIITYQPHNKVFVSSNEEVLHEFISLSRKSGFDQKNFANFFNCIGLVLISLASILIIKHKIQMIKLQNKSTNHGGDSDQNMKYFQRNVVYFN